MSAVPPAPQRDCPVCAARTRPFFHLPAAPVFCNVLHDTPALARAAAVADITLAHCPACGMIHNAAFDPSLVRYAEGYENSLHNSPHFRQYAAALVDDLAARHDLAGRTIVEIGCGDGRFLRSLCETAGARGVGFDPSAPPPAPPPEPPHLPHEQHVEIRRSLFEPASFREPVALVIARHVLEHIHHPLAFLQSLRAAAATTAPHPAAIFLEVPNALWTLRDGGIWDIIYEHCSYFTPRSLTALLARAGFAVTGAQTRYDDQFLTAEALCGPANAAQSRPIEFPPDEERLIESFARRFSDARHQSEARLDSSNDRPVVIWGAGSKGVTFLCAVDRAADRIAAAVDLNPRKHGRFTPITGHPVIAPTELPALHPRAIIVMNPVYLDEIRSAAAALSLRADIIPV